MTTNNLDGAETEFYAHQDYVNQMLGDWEENWAATEESLGYLMNPSLFDEMLIGEKNEEKVTLAMLVHLGVLKLTRNEERAKEWVNENRKFRARIMDALASINVTDIIESANRARYLAEIVQKSEDYIDHIESESELSSILENRDNIEIILAGAKVASSDWLIANWLKTGGKKLERALRKFDKKVTPEIYGSIALFERKQALYYLAPEYRNMLPWRVRSLAFPDTGIKQDQLEKEYFENTKIDQGGEAEVISLNDYRDKIQKQLAQ